MKQVGIKIEGRKNTFRYFTNSREARVYLSDLYDELQPGQAIEVKIGTSHQFIDYDDSYEKGSTGEIDRVMYYVDEYLG